MQEQEDQPPPLETLDIEGEEEESGKSYMDYRSLFIFSGTCIVRVWAQRLIESKFYKAAVITLIILNCILLACWDPLDPDAEERRNQTIAIIDFVFLILYTLEMLLNVFVKGLILHPHSYLRDPWNYLDVFVVFIGWIALIFSSVKGLSPLRALRALRPLRLISGIPQLRRIIDAVLVSIPFLIGAGLLMSVFFVVYGILGVLVFNGSLRHHCIIDDDFDENLCCNEDPGILGGFECLEGKCRVTDENIDFGFFNFDNILYAWFSIFMIINVEGWTRWTVITMDATSDLASVYYITLILIGSIFWLNLLLAVISVTMSNLPEPPKAPKKAPGILAKIWGAFKHFMIRTRPPNIIYRVCNYIVTSRSFEGLLLIVILVNLIILAMPFRRQPDWYTLTLAITDFCCLLFFTVEMILRMTGKGIWNYFTGIQNCLDFFVVITGGIEIFLQFVISGNGSSAGIATLRVLRALRLLRTLKFARRWEGLRFVIQSTIAVLPTMFYFMILFGIVTTTFMLIGIQLFGGQMNFDGEVPRFNFDTLYWSFVTLFVVTTGEQWNAIIFDDLLLNLFLSVLIDSFEDARKAKATQAREASNLAKALKNAPILLQEDEDIEMDILNDTNSTIDDPAEDSSSKNSNTETKQNKLTRNVRKEEKLGWGDRILSNPFRTERIVPLSLLGCFKDTTPPRKQIIIVVRSRLFQNMMLLLVIISCITLVIFEPGFSAFSTIGWINFSLSITFAVIFTIEMIMRMMTFGVLLPKHAYFRNGWDCIDFFVVCVSWLIIGFSFIPSIRTAALGFRAFRAIRILSRLSGTRLVVQVVLESLQVIPHILLISIFFWITFAIAGLQLFVGQYYYCEAENEFVEFIEDFDECKENGYHWVHWPSYFENVGVAFLTIVRAANVNFPDPMLHGVDVAGEDENPIRDNHPEFALFWIVFIIVCSWFILGLFIGSIVDTFNLIRERKHLGNSLFLTPAQREWLQLQRVLFTLKPRKVSKPGGTSFFRVIMFDVVVSRPFDFIILVVILFAICVQCSYHFEQPWTWELLQSVTNIVVTIIFTIEVIMKLIGFGIRGYFRLHWNKFDFVVVLISWIDVIMLFIGSSAGGLGIVRALRVARILRFVRVLKFSRKLQLLIKSTLLSLSTLINISAVMFVAFFIYVIIGVGLFYDLPQSDDINEPITRAVNWENVLHASFTNLSLFTGEAWDLVQAKVMEEKPVQGILYFFSYIFILSLLMLNLIVAVLYENLGLLVRFSFNGDATETDIDSFVDVWKKFDPNGTKFIAEEDLPKFLTTLKPPFGVGPVSEEIINRIVEELEIPVTANESVFFPDVLIILCERLYGVDAAEVVVSSIANGWRRAFPETVDVVKGRRRLSVWNDQR